MPARLHSLERMSSLVISLFAMTDTRYRAQRFYCHSDSLVNRIVAVDGNGIVANGPKETANFHCRTIAYLPPPAPSPLRNTIFNCIHPSRITAPFYSYNLDRACAREGAGRTLLIIEPRTGAGERRAWGRNTDIPACFLAGMHYNASTMHRRGIHQSYDYVSDYERHSDTGRLLLAALSIRRIDHQITHCSALGECSEHLYIRFLLMWYLSQ